MDVFVKIITIMLLIMGCAPLQIKNTESSIFSSNENAWKWDRGQSLLERGFNGDLVYRDGLAGHSGIHHCRSKASCSDVGSIWHIMPGFDKSGKALRVHKIIKQISKPLQLIDHQ